MSLIKLAISRKFFNYEDDTGFHNWKVEDIWKAKQYKNNDINVNDMQIRDNLSNSRINKADLNYPVILSGNYIVDGQHRIAKAKKLGIKTLKSVAIDLKEIPEYKR